MNIKTLRKTRKKFLQTLRQTTRNGHKDTAKKREKKGSWKLTLRQGR